MLKFSLFSADLITSMKRVVEFIVLKFSLFSADLIMSIKRVVEFAVLKFLFSVDLIQSLSTLPPPPTPHTPPPLVKLKRILFTVTIII